MNDNTNRITVEDLDRAREEYGDAYDEEIQNLDVDYFKKITINTYKDID